ncbi:anti-sigma regulatory factor (Ser/Thr protein kinase) [Actinoplanes octamycinicus]|uniref:Anti-sigma regulatory factor (Ser/Thr protein kinase) n=1 Tax=Actinoplanes octamycinicus TaxID=135948 RepID=A0A7W7H1J1_9ACTN|nr:ATP-binding protein [Actinoplanes octamycinicus]MBB4742254.1 anti-sigma regulatory factor (Ser/Thr protein kinase) [Actinoplanes octamycinicus]GIE59901.1 anti-sigma regulatory factor [Actinoplanes octamycinicus]
MLHTALIPGSDLELVTALTAELRRSAGDYDEVLLVVSDRTRALLADATHDLSGVLRWDDPAAFYQRLGFAYECFRRYLAEQAGRRRRVHVVAEPDLSDDDGPAPGRTGAYLAYESVCNDTYAPYGSAVTCVWDSRRHAADVLDGVRATHRYLLTEPGRQPSPRFLAADDFLSLRRQTLMPAPPPHVDHDRTVTEVAELRELRAALSAWAARHDFAADPADDLLVAVTEVVSNGLRHAGTPVRVRAWHHGSTLIAQCDDTAGLPIPVAAGYHRPGAEGAQPGGRGLWLARQLADAVLVDALPGRTSIRLHFPHLVMHR